MQAHQELNVAPAATDDHVESSGKGKGVLSKVKHKARKLKNKVKQVTSSNTHEHAGDANEHNTDKKDYIYSSAHENEDVAEGSDDYDNEQEDDRVNPEDNKCKGKQMLHSVGLLNDHGKGSESEVHGGIPASVLAGACWKSPDDETPVSTYKSGGPPNSFQAVPTEYHDYAINNDQLKKAGNASNAVELKSPVNPQHDRVYADDGQSKVASPIYDQIGIMREDLSADRKLGIDDRSADHATNGGDNLSAASSDKPAGYESPTPTPMQDGAKESIYKPIFVQDNSWPPFTSESINASLYGDILTAKNSRALDTSSKDLELEEAALATTPAGNSAIGIFQGLKDTVASKFGTGNASSGDDVPCAQSVEQSRSLIGGDGGQGINENDQQQFGLLETLKDTVISALGLGGDSAGTTPSKDQPDANEAPARPKKDDEQSQLANEGSMEVVQAAFL